MSEKEPEDARRPYEAPKLIKLEPEAVETGGTYVPENSAGQLEIPS